MTGFLIGLPLGLIVGIVATVRWCARIDARRYGGYMDPWSTTPSNRDAA